MSSVVISGDTSGSITLSAPAVAGTVTVTLPAASGTMATLTTPSFATTIGVGAATPSASGAGITFPATQSASSNANTLDDYEEGTWSPTVEGTSTAGTVTYSSRFGKYTKVGNVVTFSAYIGWSAGTGTGNLQIASFPFAPTGTTYPAITIIANDLTLTALNFAVAYISDSTTAALIQQCPTGGGAKTNVAYDAAVSELFLAGVYQTST